jgi:hypothetical protein
MADIKSRLRVITPSSNIEQAPTLVVNEVEASFLKLVEELKKVNSNVNLTIRESYISKYHFLLEKRKYLKPSVLEEMKKASIAVPASLTPTAGETPTAQAFTEIETFFTTTLPNYATSKGSSVYTFFDPPIQNTKFAYLSSSAQIQLNGAPPATAAPVAPVPIFESDVPSGTTLTPSQDPRRSGRIIFVNEKDVMKNTDVREFILNKGPLYGLIPYGNAGLYYYGINKLKELTRGKSSIEVIRIIAKFLPSRIAYQNIDITANAINASTFNPTPPPPQSVSAGEGILSYTYPGTNARCSLVTIGNRKVHMHTGREPQFNVKHQPVRIVLHHTDGWGESAVDTIVGVGKCLAATTETLNQFTPPANHVNQTYESWWPKSGMHYAVDGFGNTAAGTPEDVVNAGSSNWNYGGIGIEIGMPGLLTGTPGNLYWSTGQRTYRGPVPGTTNFGIANSRYIQNWEIIDLGFAYGKSDTRYTTELTDAEVVALEALIRNIISRYPAIANKINGLNQWTHVWGLPGKPVPGSTRNRTNQSAWVDGPAKNSGIVIHSTGAGSGGHDDTVPTPKLVAMLNRLGFNEG